MLFILQLPGKGKEAFSQCLYQNCILTNDQRELVSSDLVLFHGQNMPPKPPTKQPGQIWAYFILESPIYTHKLSSGFLNKFNWTISYRHDSDIPMFYGYTFKRNINHSNATIRSTTNRTAQTSKKLAAFFASNCNTQSKWEAYVRDLKKYMPVDSYGECGDKKCDKKDWKKCLELISVEYMFYLAFENSLCQDYVTEKLFKILPYNAVPVVYGAAEYR